MFLIIVVCRRTMTQDLTVAYRVLNIWKYVGYVVIMKSIKICLEINRYLTNLRLNINHRWNCVYNLTIAMFYNLYNTNLM